MSWLTDCQPSATAARVWSNVNRSRCISPASSLSRGSRSFLRTRPRSVKSKYPATPPIRAPIPIDTAIRPRSSTRLLLSQPYKERATARVMPTTRPRLRQLSRSNTLGAQPTDNVTSPARLSDCRWPTPAPPGSASRRGPAASRARRPHPPRCRRLWGFGRPVRPLASARWYSSRARSAG
jgi:hypothetical protein